MPTDVISPHKVFKQSFDLRLSVLHGFENKNITLIGSLVNSRNEIKKEKKDTLVFMGGSITSMYGYRTMLKNFWNKYFPLYPFTYGFASKSNFQIAGKMKDGVSLFQK